MDHASRLQVVKMQWYHHVHLKCRLFCCTDRCRVTKYGTERGKTWKSMDGRPHNLGGGSALGAVLVPRHHLLLSACQGTLKTSSFIVEYSQYIHLYQAFLFCKINRGTRAPADRSKKSSTKIILSKISTKLIRQNTSVTSYNKYKCSLH